MSTTFELNPDKITVYYTPKTLAIIAGGRHRRFKASVVGSDTLKEVYLAAKRFKENPSDRNEENLRKYIDKDYRVKLNSFMTQDMEGTTYLQEMPHIPLPNAVKDMFLEYIDQSLDVEPVLNLWKLALDNPSEQARKDLMTYIEQFGVPVTDNGYMILYKAVKNKDQEMVEKLSFFVGEEFFKARKERVDPHDLWVYELPDDAAFGEEYPRFWTDVEEQTIYERETEWGEPVEVDESAENYHPEDYPLTEEVDLYPVGNLAELFQDLVLNKHDVDPDEDPETDVAWTPFYSGGDYGNEIKLGEVITMPREECDPNINVSCSKGLHVGSYEYVREFYSYDEGRTILACLVNPKDIVALPQSDNSKIRTCAYMPYGIIKVDEEGHWDEVDSPYWEEDFIDYEKEELEKRIYDLHQELADTPEHKQQKIRDLIDSAKNRLHKLDG